MTPRPGHLCQHQHYICTIVKADPAGFQSWYLTTRATDGTIIAGPDSEFEMLSANVIPFPHGTQSPLACRGMPGEFGPSSSPGANSNYGDV